MPCLQNDLNCSPWEYLPLPSFTIISHGVSANILPEPTQLVWVIRFTNEAFIDYEAYSQRLDFYRKRQWKCLATGKINLTFEEALLSERRVQSQLSIFNENLLELLCRIVHHSTLTLKQLVDSIYSAYHSAATYCPSKEIIKLQITQVASRDTYPNAPWRVHPLYMEQFGLPKSLPAPLQRRHDNIIQLKKSIRPTKYIDDSILLKKIKKQTLPPAYSFPSFLSNSSVNDLIVIWRFFLRFNTIFDMEIPLLPQFESSLLSSDETIIDIHIKLLRCLYRDDLIVISSLPTQFASVLLFKESVDKYPSTKEKRNIKRMENQINDKLSIISSYNWIIFLLNYLHRYHLILLEQLPLTPFEREVLFSSNDTVSLERLSISSSNISVSIPTPLSNELTTEIPNYGRNYINKAAETIKKLSNEFHEQEEMERFTRKARMADRKMDNEDRIKFENQRKRAILRLLEASKDNNSMNDSLGRSKDNESSIITEYEKKQSHRERLKFISTYLFKDISINYKKLLMQHSLRWETLGIDRYYHSYYWSPMSGGRVLKYYRDKVKAEDNWSFYYIASSSDLDILINSLFTNGSREHSLREKLLLFYPEIIASSTTTINNNHNNHNNHKERNKEIIRKDFNLRSSKNFEYCETLNIKEDQITSNHINVESKKDTLIVEPPEKIFKSILTGKEMEGIYHAVKHTIWLLGFMRDLGYAQNNIDIYSDNKAAVEIVNAKDKISEMIKH